jgi:hypothetical protein
MIIEFVKEFDGADRKWLVSQSGKYPRWNRNGSIVMKTG